MRVSNELSVEPAGGSRRIGRSIGGFIRQAARRALSAMQESAQRRALLALSDHQLQDIGLTREEVRSNRAKSIRQPEPTAPAQSQLESRDDRRAA
jgi:uncharacterized protein YjiS (DUF1127 family)